MKKIYVLFLCGLMLLIFSACGGNSDSAGTKSNETSPSTNGESGENNEEEVVKLGISQIVEHPSLDEATKGFIAALNDNGYIEGENLEIDYQIAQGDMNNNTTIAQKLVNDGSDILLGISTPSTQSLVQATKGTDIPVLFTAVTDPLSAQIVDNLEKPSGNVTGISDTHPDAIPNAIHLIKEFFPDAKTVGTIYNTGEQNSIVNVGRAKEVMAEIGLEPVEVGISSSAEVKQAAESLIGRVDVIYISKDSTVVSALESVIAVANEHDIPTFAGDTDSVERGMFAGYGFEYFDLGYKTGKLAVEVLKGKKPSEIPVGFPDNLGLVINKKAAEEQGITLTDDMTKNAEVIGD